MNNLYPSLISGFFGALIGAGASLLTIWIQTRHWFKQQRWAQREQHYSSLLSSLNKLKLSLQNCSEYYLESGSEHNTSIAEDEGFKRHFRIVLDALQSVREQVGPAAIFLSPKATSAIESLIEKEWHAGWDAGGDTAGYIRSSLQLASDAYSSVLDEAKHELGDVK